MLSTVCELGLTALAYRADFVEQFSAPSVSVRAFPAAVARLLELSIGCMLLAGERSIARSHGQTFHNCTEDVEKAEAAVIFVVVLVCFHGCALSTQRLAIHGCVGLRILHGR